MTMTSNRLVNSGNTSSTRWTMANSVDCALCTGSKTLNDALKLSAYRIFVANRGLPSSASATGSAAQLPCKAEALLDIGYLPGRLKCSRQRFTCAVVSGANRLSHSATGADLSEQASTTG